MGDQRLRARVRGLPAPGRAGGRPPRPATHVPHRPRRLHAGLALRGARLERAVADRRPRPPGPRRGDHRSGRALDPDDDVLRGQGAQHRARRLGRRRRLRRRRGRAARRRLHRRAELGVDLLPQHPGRARRDGAHAGAARREPRHRERRASTSPGRCSSRPASRPAVFGITQANEYGWTSAATIGIFAAAGGAARRLRRVGAAHEGPADVVLDLPDQDGRAAPTSPASSSARRCSRCS